MGQQMDGVFLFIPTRTVKIIAVFRQSGEVADAEVTTARGPVFIVGRGSAKVILARPHELSYNPRLIVLPHPVVVG